MSAIRRNPETRDLYESGLSDLPVRLRKRLQDPTRALELLNGDGKALAKAPAGESEEEQSSQAKSLGETWFGCALAALERGDAATAAGLFHQALKLLKKHAPEDVAPSLIRASNQLVAYAERIDWSEAALHASHLLNSYGTSVRHEAEWHLQRGKALMMALEPQDGSTAALQDAAKAFADAAGLAQNEATKWRASLNRAEALRRWSERDAVSRKELLNEAADILQDATRTLGVDQVPDGLRARELLGLVLTDLDRPIEAITLLDEARAGYQRLSRKADGFNHTIGELLNSLAYAYAACLNTAEEDREQLLAKARALYGDAARLVDPKARPLLLGRIKQNLGDLLLAAGDTDQAVEAFEEAAKYRSIQWTPGGWVESKLKIADALLAHPTPPLPNIDRVVATCEDIIRQAPTNFSKERAYLRLALSFLARSYIADKLYNTQKSVEMLFVFFLNRGNTIHEYDYISLIIKKILINFEYNIKLNNLKSFGSVTMTNIPVDFRQALAGILAPMISKPDALEGLVTLVEQIAQAVAAGVDPAQLMAKMEPPRPTPGVLPPGMDWPTETYAEAHQKYGWNIVRFLEERWQPLIAAGAVDLRTLRKKDPSAAMAVNNYSRGGRLLPSHLRIPKFSEILDASLDESSEGELRRARRIVRRTERQRTHP